mgnify:CR=1 FL=1
MSTLKTNTLTGTTSAGSILVTGEGGSTTTNLQQGLAKAWANLNGTGTIALRDSFNIASTLDNGTGNYDIVFTNNMSDSNYAVVGESAHNAPISGGRNRHYHCVGESSSQININGYTTSNVDITFCYAGPLGDLA